MEQENEELEMQNNSNNIFDNFVNGIEEHPKEAGVGILGLLATLGMTNFIQWGKRRKEQKRHEEVENLQKDAIQKQDAQIQDYKDLSEENEYLKKLNKVLVHHDMMLKEIQEKRKRHHNLILLLQRKS